MPRPYPKEFRGDVVAQQNLATREYVLPGRTSRIAPHDQIRLS